MSARRSSTRRRTYSGRQRELRHRAIFDREARRALERELRDLQTHDDHAEDHGRAA